MRRMRYPVCFLTATRTYPTVGRTPVSASPVHWVLSPEGSLESLLDSLRDGADCGPAFNHMVIEREQEYRGVTAGQPDDLLLR